MSKQLKYPHVISSAVSPEVYDRLSTDQEELGLSTSKLIRRILEDYYEVETKRLYLLDITQDQVKVLVSQGFNIEEQE